MSKVTLVTLSVDGSVKEEKVVTGVQCVHGKEGRPTVQVTDHDVFPLNDPVDYATVAELLAAPPPMPPVDNRAKHVIHFQDSAYPIRYEPDPENGLAQKQLKALQETAARGQPMKKGAEQPGPR